MQESLISKKLYSKEEIKALNEKYRDLSVEERVKQLYVDFDASDVMLTSSFAATSALLLSVFSKSNSKQKIYFIDTGYHFPETLEYREKLTELYGLSVESVSAGKEDHAFTSKNKTWETDPELCCSINKVKPLELIKSRFSVWVSGLMSICKDCNYIWRFIVKNKCIFNAKPIPIFGWALLFV